jgi:hypothetical protein
VNFKKAEHFVAGAQNWRAQCRPDSELFTELVDYLGVAQGVVGQVWNFVFDQPTRVNRSREADIHVSRLSRENTRLSTRAAEERARTRKADSQFAYTPHGGGSCSFAEPDIHLLPRVVSTVADD